jgi:uncharacterized membrane protein YccC
METWQFSLFFAALLVGYLMVHVRVARFEEHLKRLRGLDELSKRIAALTESMASAEARRQEHGERVEHLLQQLHEDLEDLRETTAQVGQAVVHIPAPATGMPSAGAEPATAAERIRAVVETRLLQLGYAQLRLLTELRDQSLEGDVEVQVECERSHMPFKGRVLVRNGAVRDVALQTVAPTFP